MNFFYISNTELCFVNENDFSKIFFLIQKLKICHILKGPGKLLNNQKSRHKLTLTTYNIKQHITSHHTEKTDAYIVKVTATHNTVAVYHRTRECAENCKK